MGTCVFLCNCTFFCISILLIMNLPLQIVHSLFAFAQCITGSIVDVNICIVFLFQNLKLLSELII
jgi:hypothetical protein